MEFFIEGGRSRTGKACPPKGGLMSVVVDTLNKGDISTGPLIEPCHEKPCFMRPTKAQISPASVQSDQRLCCSLPR